MPEDTQFLEEAAAELEKAHPESAGPLRKFMEGVIGLVKGGKAATDEEESPAEESPEADESPLDLESPDEQDRKSFAGYAADTDSLPTIMDAEAVIGDLVKSMSEALDANFSHFEKLVKAQSKRLDKIEKALAGGQDEIRKALDGFGSTPQGRVAPYSVIRKGFGSPGGDNGIPDQQEIVSKSLAAVEAGKLTAKDARVLQLAAQAGPDTWQQEGVALWQRIAA